MQIEATLDQVHARVVQNPWLRLFTAMTRGLLALGFILPGMTKVLGHQFTSLPTTNRIGYFFDAFFQAQEYYRFVGVVQVTAGVLLLFSATATLGAVLYFPVILNIFLINISIDFGGTQVITGSMLLACTYLLCWDFDRWKTLLPGFVRVTPSSTERHLGTGMTLLAGAVGGLAALAAAGTGVALLDNRSPAKAMLIAALAVTSALALALYYRRSTGFAES